MIRKIKISWTLFLIIAAVGVLLFFVFSRISQYVPSPNSVNPAPYDDSGAPAHLDDLTDKQVESIIELVRTFGVEQPKLDRIEKALRE
jgi:hypothetical protein